jgi:hypothetical protein
MTLLTLAMLGTAAAANLEGVDEKCHDVATEVQNAIANGTSDYVELEQQDFLLNYNAMAFSFSPLHSAIPNRSGTGALSLELMIIPPLTCRQRLALGAIKTENASPTPIVPRPRIGFVFPEVGKLLPYASLGYVPPLPLFGTQAVIASGEVGFGMPLDSGLEWGVRYHFTLMKAIAEFATPFNEDDPAQKDLFVGSTFGLDVIGGWDFDGLVPYLALGFTDASTIFYVGDTPTIVNNQSPFAGLTGSLGLQWTKDWMDFAGEFYTAPGLLYTGRLRGGVIF